MSEPDDIQTLVLDGWHRAHGARMIAFAGYRMPIQYEGILAEHFWTRASAGLFDVSHMGQVTLAGEGVDVGLETLLPGDIIGLKPGRVRYSLLLADGGGIADDLMVTRLPPSPSSGVNEGEQPASASLDTNRQGQCFYMVVNGATKHHDLERLQAHLPDGIKLAYRPDWALLALQGPKAVDALARVVPGVASLAFMQAGGFAFEDASLWISRSGYTGEDGFEISVPATHVEVLATRLLAEPEVKPIGLGARDSLRLEAGLPLYGHDLGLDTDPASAGLGFAIPKRRRAEGGFPGAERIAAYLANGAPTRRIGLLVDGRLPAREGAMIHDDAVHVGTVTSGGFAPSVGAPIAMGYVQADRALPGTPLEIEVRGKRLPARVVQMPFVPHRYVRQGAHA